ncbi:MAG: mechanosensitive ion channel family protein [Elusimicrobia bacterium]|nr:mechanosensitive ion channel family protein [Elusimicrobiota bacterium]
MFNDTFQLILGRRYFGNTVQDYGIAVLIFIGITIGLYLFRTIIISRLKILAKKTSGDFDDFVVSLLEHIGPSVYLFISFYIATRALILNKAVDKVITFAFVLLVTVKVIKLLQMNISYFIGKMYIEPEDKDPSSVAAVKNITKILNGVLWACGVVFILDNLGVNISAVVAGLGIGGVAIALATQTVLADLFSSFAIFMDKPFKVGDFIIVGDLLGTVEHVGIKTTHIRSLHGEQLVFSNSDLTNSRIRNYKRMETRRIAFRVGVTYQTTLEQLKKIPPMVTNIVKKIEKAKLDRVHFFSFGDFSLVFEIVYYVLDSDYNVYMDVQQQINFGIKEEFEKEGIEFAYPTQTLFVAKEK